ncbi:3-oxoacyl-ACP synthase III family protein [Sorangium sp. KYC3313]|uniref:3-oxoacyl-ACP synthase III family protein n=1 Tax=Sorangium sp. KYC3313 TaxID=3449740 RepID=UPI003F88A30E
MIRGSTILGLGAYIPDEVRTNAFWPDSIVKTWHRWEKRIVTPGVDPGDAPAMHPVLAEETAKIEGDPFAGMRERRVASPEMRPSEMEILAARRALEAAKVRPEDIDLLLTFSLPADTVSVSTCFRVQHALGLKNARSMGINAFCHSFMTMMDMAHQYIASGALERVLLVVSTKYSDIMDYTSSISVAAGDGAAAAVMGPCPEGKGVLLSRQFTDSFFHDSMLVLRRAPLRPKARAYAFGETQTEERFYFTMHQPEVARAAVAAVPLWGERLRAEFFGGGRFAPEQVNLLVTNAAMVWYSPVIARIFGIPRERIEDNILTLSNMGAANLPISLFTALEKRRIGDGDLVMLMSHGGGASFGGIMLRWHA